MPFIKKTWPQRTGDRDTVQQVTYIDVNDVVSAEAVGDNVLFVRYARNGIPVGVSITGDEMKAALSIIYAKYETKALDGTNVLENRNALKF